MKQNNGGIPIFLSSKYLLYQKTFTVGIKCGTQDHVSLASLTKNKILKF